MPVLRRPPGSSSVCFDCVIHVFSTLCRVRRTIARPAAGAGRAAGLPLAQAARRREGRRRVAALGAVALAIALSPAIQHSKEEHARADAARSARIEGPSSRTSGASSARASVTARPPAPISRRGGVWWRRRPARSRRTRAPARRRVSSTGRSCESSASPIPPATGTVPADRIASRSAGRYACLAVTSEIPATPGNPSGVLGHPYRARIDFRSGRYAFCKVSGRPGELAIRANPAVPVPKVCGG